MLTSFGDPSPGSNFARINDLYPYEKVSDRARHYLSAALEHLHMWADFVAPLKFHPEQTTTHSLRPALALARAALETSAQAVWLMDACDALECVRRHLSLIRWDLAEHRKSKLTGEEKSAVKARDHQLLERVAEVFDSTQIAPPQGYLWVIQRACDAKDLRLAPAEAERLWRAMSGAAHGMYWTNLELSDLQIIGEYEPGHYRAIAHPDPTAMVDALQASSTMTDYGVLQFLSHSGADIEALYNSALKWLASEVPLKPTAAPDTRLRLAESYSFHEGSNPQG